MAGGSRFLDRVIEPAPLALKARSPNHWTTRELSPASQMVLQFQSRVYIRMSQSPQPNKYKTSPIPASDLLDLDKHTSSQTTIGEHSSTLDCKIPWTEEPGRLQSMGSQMRLHFTAQQKNGRGIIVRI